jgi:Transglycosylase-like domain
LPDLLRRVAALTAMSVVGIALLAPLSARSAAQMPDPARDELLARLAVPRADVQRGGALSARESALMASVESGAEAVAGRPADAPAAVTMEATLVVIPTAAPPRVVTYDGNTVWDALAKCESSGNWAINTGNGYYGGLQFSLGTWNGYGGAAFAEYPHEATRQEQIIVAERLRAARGYAPWPACRAKLGLP